MRSRGAILKDTDKSMYSSLAYLLCEVLLDIREQNEAILKELNKIRSRP